MSQLESPISLEILDHLPQGVIILRHDGTVAFWNQCLEEWTGLPKATIVETSIHAHFPHLGTPKYTSRLEPLFTGGPPATFASQFHPQFLPCSLPSGQPRIQQTVAKTIWDEPTQEWQALIIIQDISDLHRQVAESQRLRRQAQDEIVERQKHQQLLEAIRKIESTFISTKNAHQTFDEVLAQLLSISESEYGFIGEVLSQDGKPYLKTHAITNIAWNEETRALYDRHAPNMEFFNLKTLFGKVLTTEEYVISNNPQTDARRGGLPEGHPALNAFLGVPIFHGGQFLGMAGLGNRPKGYDSQLIKYLQPLLASCGKILHAYHNEQQRQQVQTALRESEERLTLATASAGMGIWDWDMIHDILKWDNTMFSLYGVAPDQFSGAYQAFANGVYPDDLSRVEEDIQLALKGKNEFTSEFRVIWPDQSIHFIAARGIVQKDQDGKPIRMIGVNWDMTQIKEIDLALRESKEEFKTLINSGPILMWTCSPDGQCDFLNAQWVEYTGIPEMEQLGLNWLQQIHPDDHEHTTNDWQAAVDSGNFFRTKFRIRHRDGSYRWFLTLANQIRDTDGQLLKWIGCNIDITAQLAAEKEMSQLQRAVDQGVEGLALLDQEGKYTYINQAHAAMYGYRVDELLGQTWKILYSRKQLVYIEETCMPEISRSGKWHGELFGLKKDGAEVPIEISLLLLTDEDASMSGLVCTCRDISERKDAEAVISQASLSLEQQNLELATTRDEALAAARSKSEFLATMSHEIRTPLNGVIGMTDLLLATGLDADQRDMVDTVKNSGEFLLTIINDILDFSKIDAGKLDLEIINFDIRKAVDEVLEILAERASQKNLELIGLIYASTPLQLQGDPGRIRQVLFNLLGNAIKFTHDGEIVIDVSVIETTRDTTTLRFAVTDTGIGIAPEVQQNLFDSFTQADSSTTRKFGGTGLGLAICRQLVTLMQGEIGVISEKGHGSIFWFTIPLSHSSTSSTTPVPNITMKDRRVCIVESNDTIRFLLQHYAESWGMICEVTPNGREGLALIQQRAKEDQSFDVAILDHTFSENRARRWTLASKTHTGRHRNTPYSTYSPYCSGKKRGRNISSARRL